MKEQTIEIRPSKKPAPAFIPYLVAITYIVIFVLAIVGLVNMKSMSTVLTCSGTILFIGFIDFIVSKVFAWYIVGVAEYKNKKLTYTITECIRGMGNGKTVITFKNIDDVKKKGKHLIVTGDITSKEQLQKEQSLKVFKIVDGNVDALYSLLKDFAEE